MLKALELVGFKSFADRTRFAFPQGITVVVGPNGSGKSNVVDAIKWVLGEQSVKSLRGKEMADVIFNGSPTRRAMNSAEITLTFDNAARMLPVDAPEVNLTRRVYRSGEGEYLINGTPCRLRDIRDMLAGTGLGAQAYSVIEQGKVDSLLQSSAKDRRVIFEEAAGISRFKLKKLEALRRLDRVGQNLLRLSDIAEEVEGRLRGVRAQANKARRYKDHTDRLQELRTHVGLTDWRRLSERLTSLETATAGITAQRDSASASMASIDARALELDTKMAELHEQVRQGESQIAALRERIAAQESSIDHERQRGRDTEKEIERYRMQVIQLSARADDLHGQWRETSDAVQTAEDHGRTIAQRLADGERLLTELIARFDQSRGEHEQLRTNQLEQMRAEASLGNEITALETQATSTAAARERSRGKITELDRNLQALSTEIERLTKSRDELAGKYDAATSERSATQQKLIDEQIHLASQQEELAGLRERKNGATERAAVIEELERRQEGVSEGVKEVLASAKAPETGPFSTVHGLVADLFSVSVEMAPVIDAALGASAQHVVAHGNADIVAHLIDRSPKFTGRVGFLWLNSSSPAPVDVADLSTKPGVVGRADKFVQTDEDHKGLVERLLASTWVVEKLEHALKMVANEAGGRSVRFVTMAGEVLEADGTLVVGPRQSVTGLISRRSQLRELKEMLAELETRVGQVQAGVSASQAELARQQQILQGQTEARRQAADALAECRVQITSAEERRAQFTQQRAALDGEQRAASVQHDTVLARIADARQKRDRLVAEQQSIATKLTGFQQQIAAIEQQRQARARENTETKIELAKSEERLGSLRSRLRQHEEAREERGKAMTEGRQQLEMCIQRAEASQWNILRAESEIADLYLRKESLVTETGRLFREREQLAAQRSQMTADSQKLRSTIHKLEEQAHAKELEANEIRHERDAMSSRLREDYGIELAELQHTLDDSTGHTLERDQVQQEIDDLRHKIQALGNVNLEALDELDQLETRHRTLSEQYKDLSDAKGSLEKIIEKINSDSRRLFAQTLETVRGHFQKLFRDLFGGGQGDIILEEGVDILESGIEVVARPPGKEPRSISLLSGGEKTLTCVAMLLAMFRSRPSPFCVLDEVDAALDEANIDRFSKVLQDFTGWTQFIIVTHSKKTMTCANTLYGVTMQESGVSKQVSVRFEDVSDDGHIRPEVLKKDSEAAA
jgi:chromosome segregation protein